jgi:hypothetical protein
MCDYINNLILRAKLIFDISVSQLSFWHGRPAQSYVIYFGLNRI